MNAPDPEALRKLRDDLPGMVQDLENQRALRGKKSAKLARPSKLCRCCGRGFEYKMVQAKELPDVDTCGDCDKLLKAGWICFISDNRYSFVKSDLPDVVNWCGKIVQIPVEYMDKLELRFKAKILKRNGSLSKPDVN